MIKIKKIINLCLILIIFWHHLYFLFTFNQKNNQRTLKLKTKTVQKEKLLKDFQNNLINEYWNYGKWYSFDNIPKKYLFASKSRTITKPRFQNNRWDVSWQNFRNFTKNYGFYQNYNERGKYYWNIFKEKKLLSFTSFENINETLHVKITLEINGFLTRENDQDFISNQWKKNFWIIYPKYRTKTFNLKIKGIGKYDSKNYFYNFQVFFELTKRENDFLSSLVIKYDQSENDQNYFLLNKQRKISVNIKLDLLQKFNYLQESIYNFSLLKYGDLSEAKKIYFENQILIKTPTKKIIDQPTFIKEALNQRKEINILDLKNEDINLLEDTYDFFNLKKVNNFLYYRNTNQKIDVFFQDFEKFDFLIKIFYLWIQKVKWKWKYFWDKTRINNIEQAIINTKIKHLYNENIVFNFKEIKLNNQKYQQKITNFIENINQKLSQYDWLTLNQKLNCAQPTIKRTIFFGPIFSYFYNYFGYDQNNCFQKTSLKNGKEKILKNIEFLQKKIFEFNTLINDLNFKSKNFTKNEASLTKLLNRGALIVNLLEEQDFKKQFVLLTIFLCQVNNQNLWNQNQENINAKIINILNSFSHSSTNETQILQVIGIKKLTNIINWQRKWYQKLSKIKIKQKKYQEENIKQKNDQKKDCDIQKINFDHLNFFKQWNINNQKLTQKIFNRLYQKIIFGREINVEKNNDFSFINDFFTINIQKNEQIKIKINSLLKSIAIIIKIENQKLLWNQLFIDQKKWWAINDDWQENQINYSIFQTMPNYQFFDLNKETLFAGTTLISGLLISQQVSLIPLILI